MTEGYPFEIAIIVSGRHVDDITMPAVPRVGDTLCVHGEKPDAPKKRYTVLAVEWDCGFDDGSAGANLECVPEKRRAPSRQNRETTS